MLLKEPERKDLSSELEESKEAKKRRLLQELKDLDEDAEVMVIFDTFAKKDKEAKEVKEAITANQIKIRCFQDLLKSTGTSPKSSFEARAGFVKSLMLALQFGAEDYVAPSLVFPLINLFEECSQDRGTFTMLVQKSKSGATWEEVPVSRVKQEPKFQETALEVFASIFTERSRIADDRKVVVTPV
jgi:hypothetical protein